MFPSFPAFFIFFQAVFWKGWNQKNRPFGTCLPTKIRVSTESQKAGTTFTTLGWYDGPGRATFEVKS